MVFRQTYWKKTPEAPPARLSHYDLSFARYPVVVFGIICSMLAWSSTDDSPNTSNSNILHLQPGSLISSL